LPSSRTPGAYAERPVHGPGGADSSYQDCGFGWPEGLLV
jgi:hypothetical protein